VSTDTAHLKQQAAERAVGFIESGMVVGLGSGSTAIWAVRGIGQRLANGQLHNIRGIPTSVVTETEARQLGIPLVTLEECPVIDVTIDGADEVDPHFNLIKGGGGALLREKIVAQASKREIIIVDESKLVEKLGRKWAVPVEVIPFGWHSQYDYLVSLGAQVNVRRSGDRVFKTDQGNLILDCQFGSIDDPAKLGAQIKTRAGIVEHGLFLDLATDVIVANPQGIRLLNRE
jgi:ribose 5-phosphate isomerase A